MRHITSICGALASLGLAASAAAHHSQAAFYDVTKVGEFEGVVTAVFWKNPHVRFNVKRIGEDGQEELWELESNSLNTLSRLGFTAPVVNVGDHVRVSGILSRFGRNEMRVTNVLLPSGEEVVLMPNLSPNGPKWAKEQPKTPAAPEPARRAAADREASGIFRVWTSSVRPNTGGPMVALPLTAAAEAGKAAWNPLTDDPGLQCKPPGMPAMMSNPYPIEFVDQGDTILLRLEEWDGMRTIHMNGGAAKIELAPTGYSTGSWDGSTLVVTTDHVSYQYFDDFGTPQTTNVKIVERFMPNADFTRLDYTASVTDPATFTAPVSIETYWYWVPGEEIKPYHCALWDQTARPHD
jgi:Family of unknown function (DUF6152)